MPRRSIHVKEPAPSTLARYGLSLKEWKALYWRFDGNCHCCGAKPSRLVIDHEHASGWNRMEDAERKRYIRGLCCTTCNHYVLTRYADAERHRKAAEYLDRYAASKVSAP